MGHYLSFPLPCVAQLPDDSHNVCLMGAGLPDGYGRGRIIGDYRRVALYGVDRLIQAKKDDLKYNLLGVMDDEKIRLREEVQEQIRALGELKEMAAAYGDDVGRPAANSREAVQVCVICHSVVLCHNVGLCCVCVETALCSSEY